MGSGAEQGVSNCHCVNSWHETAARDPPARIPNPLTLTGQEEVEAGVKAGGEERGGGWWMSDSGSYTPSRNGPPLLHNVIVVVPT